MVLSAYCSSRSVDPAPFDQIDGNSPRDRGVSLLFLLLFLLFLLFSFFRGEESATITTDLSDHGLINDAFRLAANKNLLSLLARLDEHPSAIVLRDRTRNFARISSHRHCFLR